MLRSITFSGYCHELNGRSAKVVSFQLRCLSRLSTTPQRNFILQNDILQLILSENGPTVAFVLRSFPFSPQLFQINENNESVILAFLEVANSLSRMKPVPPYEMIRPLFVFVANLLKKYVDGHHEQILEAAILAVNTMSGKLLHFF